MLFYDFVFPSCSAFKTLSCLGDHPPGVTLRGRRSVLPAQRRTRLRSVGAGTWPNSIPQEPTLNSGTAKVLQRTVRGSFLGARGYAQAAMPSDRGPGSSPRQVLQGPCLCPELPASFTSVLPEPGSPVDSVNCLVSFQ